MSITESITECVKNISSDYEILFRYTKKIKYDHQWENLLLDNRDKIFYISYPNQITYIAIGYCREYVISSNKELTGLKNIQYKIQSYGKNKNDVLKFFGGSSFNLEQKAEDLWENIPKGLFFIPKFLIIKNKEDHFISYCKYITAHSDAQKISMEYESFIKQLKNQLHVKKTDVVFDRNIPNKETYSNIFSGVDSSYGSSSSLILFMPGSINISFTIPLTRYF